MRVEGAPIVAVLGAINVDVVVSGAPLPGPGQTVTGGVFAQHHGGKGGNQAVAAARAIGRGGAVLAAWHSVRPGVWMLGSVGDDQLGIAALEALRANDVQTDHVVVTPDAPTGVALIAVGIDGENQISVAPGANATLGPDAVVAALQTLRPHVLLVSLEVPERTARAALDWAHEHDATTVLNPAPPQPWASDLLRFATFVTPNEHERAALGRIPGDVVVIETLGIDGAVIHGADGVEERIPAPSVPVVDMTGAGDCFNGVLAAGLAWGRDLPAAVREAVLAASLSVGAAGAREGMPDVTAISEARKRFGN
ncbi:MAG: ribokinase [Actinomycetota bacterium]